MSMMKHNRFDQLQTEALIYMQRHYPNKWRQYVRETWQCRGHKIPNGHAIPANVFLGLRQIRDTVTTDASELPIMTVLEEPEG